MKTDFYNIDSLGNFLKQEGLSFFRDTKCLDIHGKRRIVDILYLDYNYDVCCFEFKQKYTDVDLNKILGSLIS